MRRRGFLKLFGAGLTAPLMPQVAIGGTAERLTAAMAHAQTRVSVSAWGLSQALGVPMAEADVLMKEMSERGMIAQISGGNGRWAMSRVYSSSLPPHIQRQDAPRRQNPKMREQSRSIVSGRDDDPLLTYLREMCDTHGFAVNERAAA